MALEVRSDGIYYDGQRLDAYQFSGDTVSLPNHIVRQLPPGASLTR